MKMGDKENDSECERKKRTEKQKKTEEDQVKRKEEIDENTKDKKNTKTKHGAEIGETERGGWRRKKKCMLAETSVVTWTIPFS